ncbi:NAD-dependent epimerase/dehydratase family protein [Humibacillus xanthopallidus]|uniref:NAD-dependent epimerase/dehydratase family protein n=1 Tax=Humibacillus xanthopallidus TaxID=412689 RepID=UPI00384EA043
MRLLVLGGTHHVGRAFVEAGLARGDDVTTVNRGLTGPDAAGAETRHADRLVADSLAEALGDDEWDAVVDTWSLAPVAVQESARLLSGRAGSYCYISSRSVYSWPLEVGSDESAPVVEGDPGSTDADDYAAAKRGGELAVLSEFDGDVTLARAGLILGPYEIVGRMPFWLNRIAAAGPGGRVPAPGPRDRPLQLIDCRDIADWVLGSRPVGTFNTVSRPGHATIGQVLDASNDVTGAQADLVWLTPETIEAAGVEPWTELPIWLPPTGEYAGLHDCDVSAALAAGLSCRPIEQTVADTWAWLQREGLPERPKGRVGTPMDAAAEARLWAAHERA